MWSGSARGPDNREAAGGERAGGDSDAATSFAEHAAGAGDEDAAGSAGEIQEQQGTVGDDQELEFHAHLAGSHLVTSIFFKALSPAALGIVNLYGTV